MQLQRGLTQISGALRRMLTIVSTLARMGEIQKYIQHYFLIIRVDFLLIINVISP